MPISETFTPEQVAQFRSTFKPQADRYRLYSSLFIPSCLLLFGGGVLFQFCHGWAKIIPILTLAAGALLLLAVMFVPMPKCPGCGRRFSSSITTHCPECGRASVTQRPGGLFRPPQHKCEGCGKELWAGKGRTFKIRACTQCGVILDDEGL
jgi:hypothetical protein